MDYAKSTLIHELGHAYDYYSNRPSHNSDFKSIYNSEKSYIKMGFDEYLEFRGIFEFDSFLSDF